MGMSLRNKTIAILATDGFEQVELTQPRRALDAAGATTHIVSPAGAKVQGWNHHDKAHAFAVESQLDDAKAAD